METKNIIFLIIAVIMAISLIIFLIRRNREDIKTMNPDASDAIEEMRTEKERKRDKT